MGVCCIMTNNITPLRVVNTTYVTKELLVNNLIQRKARIVDETGLSIEWESSVGITFFTPQPLVNGEYYTISQLEKIDEAVCAADIELLPIDYNLASQ